tara:strand:- start:634 stop:1461 length:828 start_codon:yes stop_codon:yes gene_type:complete
MKILDSNYKSKKLENELTSCLSQIGLRSDDNIYITGNMGLLGKVRIKKTHKLEAFLNSFWNIIGNKGTIFSPAASMNLCNTDIPFDIELTKSHEMGSFAEYIRKLPNAVRSLHPFWSIAGIGANAHLLNKVSRHAYGAGSPWSHLLNLDATQVNVGIDPARAVTLIHHIETLVGVPYRYTKEFIHPILKNGKVKYEPFYQSVFYNESKVKKRVALNEHYFNELELRGKIQCSVHSSGLEFKAFKMRDFYEVALEFFIDNMYNYLEEVPNIKPYKN